MDIKNLKFGSLDAFNVLIEIEQGSNLKYEYDEDSERLKLNFVFENLVFPFYYGFIAGTLGGDGDSLDAIILSSAAIKPGGVVKCKAIGIFKTIDRGEVDDKIICVPVSDPLAQKYHDISDLPPDTSQKWTEFYMEVARQKKKILQIKGLKNKEEALKEIKRSIVK